MREDDVPSSNYWAEEVLNVDPQNLDAHYTLGDRGTRRPPAQFARGASPSRGARQRRRHRRSACFWSERCSPTRAAIVAGRADALAQARAITLGPDADPVDRLAAPPDRVDGDSVRDRSRSTGRTGRATCSSRSRRWALADELAPARVARLRFLLEQTQKSLMDKSATAVGGDQERASTDWSTRSKPSSSRSSSSRLPATDEPDLQTYRRLCRPPEAAAPARSLPGSDRTGTEVTPGVAADRRPRS